MTDEGKATHEKIIQNLHEHYEGHPEEYRIVVQNAHLWTMRELSELIKTVDNINKRITDIEAASLDKKTVADLQSVIDGMRGIVFVGSMMKSAAGTIVIIAAAAILFKDTLLQWLGLKQ